MKRVTINAFCERTNKIEMSKKKKKKKAASFIVMAAFFFFSWKNIVIKKTPSRNKMKWKIYINIDNVKISNISSSVLLFFDSTQGLE